MLLSNYYYYFQSALSTKFCEEVLEYGKKHILQDAVTHVDNPGGKEDYKTIEDDS